MVVEVRREVGYCAKLGSLFCERVSKNALLCPSEERTLTHIGSPACAFLFSISGIIWSGTMG